MYVFTVQVKDVYTKLNKLNQSFVIAIVFSPTPTDCSEFPPGTCTGVYTIQPENGPNMILFCDMNTDGGGEFETLIFCKLLSISIGNDNLYYILRQNSYQVRFDLEEVNSSTAYAVYDTIYVADESTNYQLTINGYSGTVGDSMIDVKNIPTDGMMFSTRDRDNDINPSKMCSITQKSGWCHPRCTHANINGLFMIESDSKAHFQWKSWRKDGITKTRMMDKPSNY
ncbi:unnamed protein product [Mytilus coruscus]|uniref:Fibrinogen C-terminal domain-containing protein n=1 Tax=Mytilus coruscus TaxID=42192 RepID=A0A6J8CIQ7_MYTCO|nr:unnamed protein product [Mytilus coruscus]